MKKHFRHHIFLAFNPLFFLVALFCEQTATFAQPIAQETFEAFNVAPFSGGSNSGVGQWSGFWMVDNSDRLAIKDNRPDFAMKSPGMGTTNGQKQSLVLRTSTGSSLAYRDYTPFDIPFYISFLLSIDSVGTGGGFLDLLLYRGSTGAEVIRLVPDIDRQAGAFYFKGTSGAFNAIPSQPFGDPMLIVMKIQDPQLTSSAAIRFNPDATTTYSNSYVGQISGPPIYFGRIGFRVGRTTTSGSDSIFRVDELKIGFSRADGGNSSFR